MIMIIGLNDVLMAPLLAAIFAIVYVVSLRVLPEMHVTGAARHVMAFCVAALSALGVAVLGLHQPAPTPSEPAHGMVYALLLPYATLGIALLVLLFIMLFSWLVDGWKKRNQWNDRHVKHPTRIEEARHPTDRLPEFPRLREWDQRQLERKHLTRKDFDQRSR